MNYQERTVMRPFLSENTANLETLATRYGFSPEAAQTLLQALRAGGGTMAQFSHPELGGAGQWTKGGLIMIGDMFNRTLKARVDGLCSELSHLLLQGQTQTQRHPAAADAENGADHWWGVDLGASVTSGSQNNIRYAYFSATQRLAVLQDRQVTITIQEVTALPAFRNNKAPPVP